MAASCAASAVPASVEPGRDPLAGLQALVGAEPADLGDDLLDGGDLRLGGGVAEAAVGRPVGDDHRLAAGQRGPQRLGDERDDRVQQPQRDVEDLAEHPARRPSAASPPAAKVVLDSSTYQSKTSSHAKW